MSYDDIRSRVRQYYDAKLEKHGATAKGVDWNLPESQRLRFTELLRIVDRDGSFTINDYGCGYGALADFLRAEGFAFSYCGFDISAQMLAKASELHASGDQVRFVSEPDSLIEADYNVASGIFNVKLCTPEAEWQRYMLDTLDAMNELSGRGLAFNALTNYSDPELRRRDLYYADPLFLFDYCKTKFSRFVSLIHNYPLYEFTILVKKG